MFALKVNTIVNSTDNENFYNCIKSVQNEFSEKSSTQNLIELIEQNTVILKAFCSENLISFVVDNNEEILENTSSINAQQNDNVEYYDGNDNEDYSDNYEYSNKNVVDKNKNKILLTFAPETIFKGTSILRKLELFNNQEYFLIKG
jgi:hypothetical protein